MTHETPTPMLDMEHAASRIGALSAKGTGWASKLQHNAIREACQTLVDARFPRDVDDETLEFWMIRCAVLKPAWFRSADFNGTQNLGVLRAIAFTSSDSYSESRRRRKRRD